MGRVIKNSDIFLYKIDESNGNLIIPKSKSLTQRDHHIVTKSLLPVIKTTKKSHSLHYDHIKNSDKMLTNQIRFFKVKEPKIDCFSVNKPVNCSFRKNSHSPPHKKRSLSPMRFYDMEKSDFFRRFRVPDCLILKETKYNGHKGLYGKETNNGKIQGNCSFIGGETQRPQQINIEKQIVKELNLHSIYFMLFFIVFFSLVNKKQLNIKVKRLMDEMFKYSLKPQNSFFKSNEAFHTKFANVGRKPIFSRRNFELKAIL